MKTYSILYALVALVVLGCSTSEDTSTNLTETGEETFYAADYALLMKNNGELTVQTLEATKTGFEFSSAESSFENIPVPELTFREGSTFAFYTKLTACDGQVVLHDFNEDGSKTVDVFGDKMDCTLEVTSIAFSGGVLFVAYTIEETSKIDRYFVRAIDLAQEENNSTDIALDKKPVQMAITNGRLFVLTFDLDITEEYGLSVIDMASLSVIHEKGLGYDVVNIFADTRQQLIISYEELHTILNSATLGVQYVNYGGATAPEFNRVEQNFFDEAGRLFYVKPIIADFVGIPAIYDFTNNLGVLYYYENFLTATQLGIEYKIGNTTMVSYDVTNDVMIVGYQKSDDADKGGLLRIQLEPGPEFLGNIDLNGVPYRFFFQD